MITKELFKECMENLQKYNEWENKLYELGVNFWEREELQNMISSFMNLLQYCCKDYVAPENNLDPTNIDWFIYDCEWGKNPNEYYILEDNDSKKRYLNNLDDLWNYLVELHPEIEDKENSGDN